jgi:hypothetical protein
VDVCSLQYPVGRRRIRIAKSVEAAYGPAGGAHKPPLQI